MRPTSKGTRAAAPALAVLACALMASVLLAVAPGRPVRYLLYLLSAFTSVTDNRGNAFAAAPSFQSYPEVVKADSPSVYYRGEEPDGSDQALDSSGNNATGGYLSVTPSFQVPGGPAGGSGAGADTAVQFSGDSSTAASPSMSVPAAFTYGIWFRTTSTADARLVSFGDASSGYSTTVDRYVTLTAAGALTLTVGTSTITSNVSGLNNGSWHLLGASLGAAGMRLYADGVEVASDAATTTAATFTGYLRFEGSGIGYWPTPVNNPTTFSLELWFRTSSTTGGDLVSFRNSMTGDSSVYDRIWKMMDDGTITFGIYSGGAIVSATTTAAYNDGQWHHGVLTLSPATGMTMYVDGLVAATNPSPGAPQNYWGHWRGGGGKKWVTPPTSEFFYGDLDEVAIYPSALSAQQVARHYRTNT